MVYLDQQKVYSQFLLITNDGNPIEQGLESVTGNVGFETEKRDMFSVNLNNTNIRKKAIMFSGDVGLVLSMPCKG